MTDTNNDLNDNNEPENTDPAGQTAVDSEPEPEPQTAVEELERLPQGDFPILQPLN